MFWTAASLQYLPQAQQNSSQDTSTAIAFSARCLLELCGELVGKILNSPTNGLVCLKLFHPAFVSLFTSVPQKGLEWVLSQDGHFSSMTPGKG